MNTRVHNLILPYGLTNPPPWAILSLSLTRAAAPGFLGVGLGPTALVVVFPSLRELDVKILILSMIMLLAVLAVKLLNLPVVGVLAAYTIVSGCIAVLVNDFIVWRTGK